MSFLRVLFFLLIPSLFLVGQPTYTTIAGKPPAEGPALTLPLGNITAGDLAEDAQGNLYFAADHVIYQIAPSGNATRYAGTGWTDGGTEDGGLARETRLSRPSRLTFGPDGNLYFMEIEARSRIRVIDRTTLRIRTVFMPETRTGTDWPSPFFAIEPDGNLIVSRYFFGGARAVLFRVNASNGAILGTVAGGGTADPAPGPPTNIRIEALQDIAMDAGGNLLIYDLFGFLLRLNRTSGLLEIAAMPTEVLSLGSRIRPLANGDLLFMGNLGTAVYRFSLQTRTATFLAGYRGGISSAPVEGGTATSSGYSFPDALIRSGSGELVVSHPVAWDGTYPPRNRVPLWRVESGTGVYRRVAGSDADTQLGSAPADTRLLSPKALVAAGDGTVLIHDSRDVLKLRGSEPVTSLFPWAFEIASWTAASSNLLYFKSGLAGYRHGPTTAPPVRSIGLPDFIESPVGFLADDSVVVGRNGRLDRIDGSTSTTIATPQDANVATVRGPVRIAPNGDIYYASFHYIVRYRAATSSFERIAMIPLESLIDLDIDSDGTVYYTLGEGTGLVRIDANTYNQTTIVAPLPLLETDPWYRQSRNTVSIDRTTGDAYFLETELKSVRKISSLRTYQPNPNVGIGMAGEFVFAPFGGTITIPIRAATSATAWQATADDPWVIFDRPTAGTGDGVLQISVQMNPGSTVRQTNVRVNGAVLRIVQERPSCTYNISPRSMDLPYSSSNWTQVVEVTTQPGCRWSVASDFPWAYQPGVAPGTPLSGSQSVILTILPNTGAFNRASSLSIAGESFVARQAPQFPSVPLKFTPLPPCRILDTRLPNDTYGGPMLRAQSTRSVPLAGQCGIPWGARAASLNVTVVPKSQMGYITVWQTGVPRPTASTMNSLDGRIKANAVITGLIPSNQQSIDLFANGDTDVIVDTNGYFSEASDLVFYPVAPCRVADTRLATGAFGGPELQSGVARTFPVRQSQCGIPATAQAYVMSATVVPTPQGVGYLTLFPTGQTRPGVSTLNAVTGTIVANMAIVPAGSNGSIDAFVNQNTHLLLDITGYFAPPGAAGEGLRLFPVSACRVADTRIGFNPQPLRPDFTIGVAAAAGPCEIPPTASALALNATVLPVNAGPVGYLTLWAAETAMPLASTLNALDGAFTSSAAILPVRSGNAGIQAFANGTAHLLVDVSGYFVP